MRNPERIQYPYLNKIKKSIIPIKNGGTSAVRVSLDPITQEPGAVEFLELIPNSAKAMDNGVLVTDQTIAGLKNTGKVDTSLIPASMGSDISLSGPSTIGFGVDYEYKITDYDSRTTYDVSFELGTISINEDTITINATPMESEGIIINDYIIINGIQKPITLMSIVNPPTILYPLNNETSVNIKPYILLDDYIPCDINDTHINTSWQVSTSDDFTLGNMVINIANSTVFKIKYEITTALNPNTIYYCRAKFKGSTAGYSDWCTPVKFTTAASGIYKPVITEPQTGTIFPLTSNIDVVTSDFISSVNGETHASSSWQVSTVSNFATTVINIVDDATHKTTYSINSVAENLLNDTNYFIRVRYKGSSGNYSPYSNVVSFKLSASAGKISKTPSIIAPISGSIIDYGSNVVLKGSVYSPIVPNETHEKTRWQVSNDVNFNNILLDINDDVVNKTSYTLLSTLPWLVKNTIYYCRVSYKGTSSQYSNWSDASNFNLYEIIVTKPSVLTPINGAGFYATKPITSTSSAFISNKTEDKHYASQWQVSLVSNFTSTVIDSGETTTNKTSYTFTMNDDNTYYVRVRYKGSLSSWCEWSNPNHFVTTYKSDTPEILYPNNEEYLSVSHPLIIKASDFSSDAVEAHFDSTWQAASDLAFTKILKEKNKDNYVNADIIDNYDLAKTFTNGYISGVLDSNNNVHFIPYAATVGQKINSNKSVSTYSLVYVGGANGYFGGVLAPNNDVHFIPCSATVGQKISSSGVVSTYSLVFTRANAYHGGVLASNGSIHFVPFTAINDGGDFIGQKITNNVVSTYELLYCASEAYKGGVLASNNDIHFIPYNATVGQKVNSSGVVSTYSLAYTTTSAYSGGILDSNGNIYFIPYNASVGQKITSAGVVTTFQLKYTTLNAYYGGILAPNGDVYFIPYNASVGQKISKTGVVSTYSLSYSVTNAYVGGVLDSDKNIHLVPYNADRGQVILNDLKMPLTNIYFDFPTKQVETYSIPHLIPGTDSVLLQNKFQGGALCPNGDVHFAPYGSKKGMKVNKYGLVSTYNIYYDSIYGLTHNGASLDSNNYIHFIPYNASKGQKISPTGVVSTYSLQYTILGAYAGGVLDSDGALHFVPSNAIIGQKINTNNSVSTYSLANPPGVNGTHGYRYYGGVLSQDNEIYFIPYFSNVGQKIEVDKSVSTYSLAYAHPFNPNVITSGGYLGGIINSAGVIHFIPYNAPVGQKVNSNKSVSTYSLIYTGSMAYAGGILAPNGDIHFIPYNAPVGQKVSLSGVVSTYSLSHTTSNAYVGGVIDSENNINFIPAFAELGQKINLDFYLGDVYTRVKYKGSVTEWSDWSPVINYKLLTQSTSKPTITSPLENTGFTTGTPITCKTSGFTSDVPGDLHLTTTWQLASDINFTNVLQNIESSTDKLSHVFTALNVTVDTPYYIRAKHKGNKSGYSLWSDTRKIMVNRLSTRAPSVLTPVENTNIKVKTNFTVTTSVFRSNVSGDTHVSTWWQLSDDVNFNNILIDVVSITDKLSRVFTGLTTIADKAYYIRVKHRGQKTDFSDWSSTRKINTKIYNPVLTSFVGNLVWFVRYISNDQGTGYEYIKNKLYLSPFTSPNPDETANSVEIMYAWENFGSKEHYTVTRAINNSNIYDIDLKEALTPHYSVAFNEGLDVYAYVRYLGSYGKYSDQKNVMVFKNNYYNTYFGQFFTGNLGPWPGGPSASVHISAYTDIGYKEYLNYQTIAPSGSTAVFSHNGNDLWVTFSPTVIDNEHLTFSMPGLGATFYFTVPDPG